MGERFSPSESLGLAFYDGREWNVNHDQKRDAFSYSK